MTVQRRRDYKDYDAYLEHQMEKTKGPRLRKRLKNRFVGKVKKFKRRFNHLL